MDFEPPAYTAGQSINGGFDGWVRFGGADGRVTPDVARGYVPPTYPILAGTQSFVHYSSGGYGNNWGAGSANIASAFNYSMLIRTEIDAAA